MRLLQQCAFAGRIMVWFLVGGGPIVAGCAAGDAAKVESTSTDGSTGAGSRANGDAAGDAPLASPPADACTICSGMDAGVAGPDDGGADSSDDAAPQRDALAPQDAPGADDSMSPPLEAGPGDSGGSDDGGVNSCATKICIDPVFDCPLQGCFNGCANFFCK
jgi:hypothetical protein